MRVFLVDDEFLQRALVKKTVDWNSLGMEICGEAEDGEEALKKILEEKPDILIMDINIPYMNGIEVSKKVKVIFPEIQVIILTAYGEFEYAREALSFGAVSFVLKPLDPEELTKELQKCKEKLEHIYRQKSSVKKMQKDQFLLEQLSGMVPSENQQSKWEEMKIPFDKPLSVALIRPENKQQNNKMAEEMEEIIQDYFPVYEMISMNQGYAFILFGEENMEYQIQLLCTYMQEIMNSKRNWNGGISRVFSDIRELKAAYQEAYSAARKGKTEQKILIYEPVDMFQFIRSSLYDSEVFLYYIRKNEYEMLTKEIDEMFIQMEEQNVLSDTAVYISTDILIHICLYMSELGVDFSLVVEKEQRQLTGLQNNGGIEEIRSVLMCILEKCRICAAENKLPATKKKVNDAVDFIDSNYSRIDMSLNLVADTIGVNASYLSNIFKKEKGCSLSKYLTQTRLEQAKKYLTEYPDKTLIEIAESIGYSDVYYFSNNFKKYYGISPSKYQEERKM